MLYGQFHQHLETKRSVTASTKTNGPSEGFLPYGVDRALYWLAISGQKWIRGSVTADERDGQCARAATTKYLLAALRTLSQCSLGAFSALLYSVRRMEYSALLSSAARYSPLMCMRNSRVVRSTTIPPSRRRTYVGLCSLTVATALTLSSPHRPNPGADHKIFLSIE